MRKYIVYMLQCVDDSFYIGITSDLPMRMDDHYNGFNEGCYTYKRLPVELVYSTSFEYVLDAIAWEKRIKRWSRAKKEALMSANIQRLHALAECKNESHSKNHSSSLGSARDDSDPAHGENREPVIL